jgi:Zn-dependent peptidase ImmA (M78 family)
MQLPRQMTIGSTVYDIYTCYKPDAKYYGNCYYDLKTIEINTAAKPAEIRDTLWHEVTHAILKDMGHKLHANEAFVTAFSNRLTKAIDSARF